MIEVAPYHSRHLLNFYPHDAALPPMISVAGLFDMPAFDFLSFIKKRETMAIAGYAAYAPDRYYLQACFSKNACTASLIFMRRFFVKTAKMAGAVRVETESADDPQLNRLHRIMGFSMEGTKMKKIGNKNYHCWGIVWA
jgi:hypothetical protein